MVENVGKESSMGLSRREFLLIGAAAGAVAAAGVVLPISILARDGESGGLAMLGVFDRRRIGSLADFRDGGEIRFDYPLDGQANIAVKLGTQAHGGVGPDGDIVSYSRLCTHMGCAIDDFQAEHGVLGPCPCHFSTFDLGADGQVVLGQATQNLPRVLLEVEDEQVYATAVFRLVYGYHNTLAGV